MKILCKIELLDGRKTIETLKAKSRDDALTQIEKNFEKFTSCEFWDTTTDDHKLLGKATQLKEEGKESEVSPKKKKSVEELILEETRESNKQLEKIKWGVRSVAIGLLVIIFFGIKLTIK